MIINNTRKQWSKFIK